MTGIREEVLGDGVLRWSIDRPDRRNAVDPSTLEWIARRCAALTGETVVLTGVGPTFCAGFDLEALERALGEGLPDGSLVAATDAIDGADAVFIAAVRGHTLGAGVELMAACDVRFAADDARFTVPAGRLGVIYHARGLTRIRAVFGDALTSRMVLAGDSVSALEAEAAGALTARIDGADLQSHAEAFARRTREGAPQSRMAHRQWLRRLARGAVGPEQTEAYEQARREAYASDDYVRRLRALRSPGK